MKDGLTQIDTLIISDLHLGFKFCRAEKLIEVLKNYSYKRLILNGDIFDDLNFNRLNSEHWDVLSYIRHASKTKEVVWIIGNHDGQAQILSKLVGLKVHNYYIWQEKNKKCLAIHGHQFDRLISKNPLISYVAGWLYYGIKFFEHNNQAITDWIRRTNRSWLRLSDEVSKKAIWFGQWHKADFVFCGHTHQALELKKSDIYYYNSGSWVDSPSTLITIKDGEVKLVNFK
jgi:UDP-2,3-diacylglucosamine pyrophosphatase LpxH